MPLICYQQGKQILSGLVSFYFASPAVLYIHHHFSSGSIVSSCFAVSCRPVVSSFLQSTLTFPSRENPSLLPIGLIMETIELKVEMVGVHEKKLRKCLSKLKGIEKVEVEAGSQKVAVTGYVNKNRVLKALRRVGLKAEFWSPQNEILLNAYASGSFGGLRFNNFGFV